MNKPVSSTPFRSVDRLPEIAGGEGSLAVASPACAVVPDGSDVGGAAAWQHSEQYRRLFGDTPPTRAIRCLDQAGLEDVLAQRELQIRRGQTAESDADKTILEFVSLVRSQVQYAEEAWPHQKSCRDKDELRHRLVNLGALTLAFIDRLDSDPG